MLRPLTIKRPTVVPDSRTRAEHNFPPSHSSEIGLINQSIPSSAAFDIAVTVCIGVRHSNHTALKRSARARIHSSTCVMSVSKAVQNVTKAPKGVTDFHLATTVTDDVLKALKFSCRNDSKSIDDAARCLLLDLASRSAIVRLRSLSVIDSLFLRSKEFRKRISVNIRSIAECAGFLGGKHLDNVEHRNILEHRVKEMLEMWDMYYGDFLPEIRALVRHMKEFLHLVMPDIKVHCCCYPNG